MFGKYYELGIFSPVLINKYVQIIRCGQGNIYFLVLKFVWIISVNLLKLLPSNESWQFLKNTIIAS